MTTPQRRAEAGAVANTFHVAMVSLGAKTAADVMLMWQGVVPTSTRVGETGLRFFEEALSLVRFNRHKVQAIAIPYLRLYRALATGHTFQPIFDAEPEAVTLSYLREDFIQAVEAFAPDALIDSEIVDRDPTDLDDSPGEVQTPDSRPYTPYRPSDWNYYVSVTTEEFEQLERLLDEEEARAEAEADAVIQNLGHKLLQEKLARLAEEESRSAQEVDELQEEEHGKVGRRVSGHAERLVQNGGRYTLTEVGHADPRVIGFVRVHYPEKDPQPCGFCALLISKGIEFRPYTSEKSASTTKEGSAARERWGKDLEEYHPRCHCEAVPIYSQEEYDEGSRFDINRALLKLYSEEYVDMTQWRRLMRTRAAQAAAGQKE